MTDLSVTDAGLDAAANHACDLVGVTPYSDMRPFIIEAIRAYEAHRSRTEEPVAWRRRCRDSDSFFDVTLDKNVAELWQTFPNQIVEPLYASPAKAGVTDPICVKCASQQEGPVPLECTCHLRGTDPAKAGELEELRERLVQSNERWERTRGRQREAEIRAEDAEALARRKDEALRGLLERDRRRYDDTPEAQAHFKRNNAKFLAALSDSPASAAPDLAALRHECARSNMHDHDGCSCTDAELLAKRAYASAARPAVTDALLLKIAKAWEALPGGEYSGREGARQIEVWLRDAMKPAIDEARAFLAEEWLPIETAPRDGTRFWAWPCEFKDGPEVVEAYWYVHSSVQGWLTDELDCMDYEFEPTHWRPQSKPADPLPAQEGSR